MSKIKLIREKYQYVDQQTGEIKDRTLNIPHYFCEIEFIVLAPLFPDRGCILS